MKNIISLLFLFACLSTSFAQDYRIDTISPTEFQIVEIFERGDYTIERKHPVTDEIETVDFFLDNAASAYEKASARIEQSNEKLITARIAERLIREMTGTTWQQVQTDRILQDSSFVGDWQLTVNDSTYQLECRNGRTLRKDNSNYAVILPKNENIIYLRFLSDDKRVFLFTRNGGRAYINQRTEDDNYILRKQ